MRFSKSAIKSRQKQVAFMTLMPESSGVSPEIVDRSERTKTYSTEWYNKSSDLEAGPFEKLRRLHVATSQKIEQPTDVPTDQVNFLRGKHGFFW